MHQRRLAGPRRAHDGDELARHHRQRDAAERVDRGLPLAVAASHVGRGHDRIPVHVPVCAHLAEPTDRPWGWTYGYPYISALRGGDGIRPSGGARDVAGWAHGRGRNPSGGSALAVGRRTRRVGRGSLGRARDGGTDAPRLRGPRVDRCEHHRVSPGAPVDVAERRRRVGALARGAFPRPLREARAGRRRGHRSPGRGRRPTSRCASRWSRSASSRSGRGH